MAQLFTPLANTGTRLVLMAIVLAPVLALTVAVALQWSPLETRQGQILEQPVPFSHKHHVGEIGLDCRFCHATVERTAFAGMPTTHVCMTCHSQLFTSAPMLAPVRQSLADGTPLTWNRVNVLPDYVYFDHSIHVAKGVGCAECHGAVHDMPLMRQAAPLTMGWCLNCHRDPGARLRPLAAVTDTQVLSHNTLEQARQFLIAYKVHPAHLTNCSTCHR